MIVKQGVEPEKYYHLNNTELGGNYWKQETDEDQVDYPAEAKI